MKIGLDATKIGVRLHPDKGWYDVYYNRKKIGLIDFTLCKNCKVKSKFILKLWTNPDDLIDEPRIEIHAKTIKAIKRLLSEEFQTFV